MIMDGSQREFGPGHSHPRALLHSTSFFRTRVSEIFCSYITAKPATSSLHLLAAPAAVVILATDGIWDELSSEVAARIATDAAASGTVQPASAIMNAAFEHAAAYSHMTVAQLKNMQPGSQRRRLVDDCTVVVGVFGNRSKL